jgi:hypothetical protein
LVEFVVVRGANQMMVIGLGWFVSVRDAGVLRGVTTLYGPLNVLVQTVALFGAPVLLGLAPRQRARAIVWMGTGLCFIGAAMTVILLLVPQSVGRAFLGATWSGSGPLILPLGVQAIAVGIVAATFVGIRTVSPRLTLPVQMASSAVFVFLYGLGVWRDGVAGAAWAFGVGTLVQGALGAVVYRREVKKEALRAGARFEATGLETVSKGHASWTTHE